MQPGAMGAHPSHPLHPSHLLHLIYQRGSRRPPPPPPPPRLPRSKPPPPPPPPPIGLGRASFTTSGRPSILNSFSSEMALLGFLVAGHLDESESPCPARGHVAHDARAFHGPGPAEELGELGFAGLIGKVSHVQLATHNADSSVPCGTHKKSRSGPDGPRRSFTSESCVRSVETEAGGSARSALRRNRRSGARQLQYTPHDGLAVRSSWLV